MMDRAEKRKAIADKVAADIPRLTAEIAKRREKLAKAKERAQPGKGKLAAGWFAIWDRAVMPIARAEGSLARAIKRAPIAQTKAQETAARARQLAAAKIRRDAQTASINRHFETVHAGPHPQARWNAERAEEAKRMKRLTKQIHKRTSKDFSNRFMLEKPLKLPDPVQQPDLTAEAEAPAIAPREGLIPGTFKVMDPARLRGGLLDADPLPPRWTARRVGERLIEAMDVLQRMPMTLWPKGYGAMWPAYRHEAGELAHQAGAGTLAIGRNVIARTATADEVDRMNEALEWPLQYLAQCNAWSLRALNGWAMEAIDADGEDAPTDLLQFIADALNAAKEVVR